MVSAFTITVIAIDRWRSVIKMGPVDGLTYNQVGLVIGSIWAMSFACKGYIPVRLFFFEKNPFCRPIPIIIPLRLFVPLRLLTFS